MEQVTATDSSTGYLLGTRRWISGMRNRSYTTPQCQARADAHARAALVRPLHGHDGDRVATLAREVNDLGVEDDARDLLAREQVVRGLAREALEAALRVGHGTRDPGTSEGVEHPAQQPAVEGLARAPVGAVGLDAAAQRDVVVGQRIGSSGSWSGGVAMSESAKTTRSPWRVEHARLHGRALARVRSRLMRVAGRRVRRRWPPGGPATMSAVSSVLPSSTTRTSTRPMSLAGGRRRAPARPLQISEQLVERRADARRFVVGGQHQRDARLGAYC